MEYIQNQKFDQERALYNLKDTLVYNCHFEGPFDGESALKECRNVIVNYSRFALRYPLWHAQKYEIRNSFFCTTSRAPIWYAIGGKLERCQIYSVKAVRECDDIEINNSTIISDEFGWRNKNIKIHNSKLEAEYALFESKDIEIDSVTFKGKYSFQYIENAKISNSNFETKDAFWHCKNVIVTNSVINGQYLGWFSDGLTLIHCKIIGTQPLCYCKNLKLIDCEMIDCDLAFEYSDVNASINGYIESVKNPKSGVIEVNQVGEIITTDSIMENSCEIVIKK